MKMKVEVRLKKPRSVTGVWLAVSNYDILLSVVSSENI